MNYSLILIFTNTTLSLACTLVLPTIRSKCRECGWSKQLKLGMKHTFGNDWTPYVDQTDRKYYTSSKCSLYCRLYTRLSRSPHGICGQNIAYLLHMGIYMYKILKSWICMFGASVSGQFGSTQLFQKTSRPWPWPQYSRFLMRSMSTSIDLI